MSIATSCAHHSRAIILRPDAANSCHEVTASCDGCQRIGVQLRQFSRQVPNLEVAQTCQLAKGAVDRGGGAVDVQCAGRLDGRADRVLAF